MVFYEKENNEWTDSKTVLIIINFKLQDFIVMDKNINHSPENCWYKQLVTHYTYIVLRKKKYKTIY